MPQLQEREPATEEDQEETIEFDLGDTFDVEEAKDDDFELDMDAAEFQGKKGQAGTRSKNS